MLANMPYNAFIMYL